MSNGCNLYIYGTGGMSQLYVGVPRSAVQYCTLSCKASTDASLGINHCTWFDLVWLHSLLPCTLSQPPPPCPPRPCLAAVGSTPSSNSQDSPPVASSHQVRITQKRWPTHRLAPLTALANRTWFGIPSPCWKYLGSISSTCI